jgi:hypothetical protein
MIKNFSNLIFENANWNEVFFLIGLSRQLVLLYVILVSDSSKYLINVW